MSTFKTYIFSCVNSDKLMNYYYQYKTAAIRFDKNCQNLQIIYLRTFT